MIIPSFLAFIIVFKKNCIRSGSIQFISNMRPIYSIWIGVLIFLLK